MNEQILKEFGEFRFDESDYFVITDNADLVYVDWDSLKNVYLPNSQTRGVDKD